MNNSYIGLGSNLQQPQQQLQMAMLEISQLPQTCLLKKSSYYVTRPVGPQDQPNFINAVVLVRTALSALDLLHELQQLELLHQRQRLRHWGERTLDLDILLYSSLVINNIDLVIPHPGLEQRLFVLQPLQEIAPEMILPSGISIVEQIYKLRAQS